MFTPVNRAHVNRFLRGFADFTRGSPWPTLRISAKIPSHAPKTRSEHFMTTVPFAVVDAFTAPRFSVGRPLSEMPSTHWSMIRAASGNDEAARAALARTCEAYWSPVYYFVLRREPNPAEALEITQQFFADLVARNDLARVDPSLGRFRSWIYGCLRHALSNRIRYRKARPGLSPDDVDVQVLLGTSIDAEREFTHHWARSVYSKARVTAQRNMPRVAPLVFDLAIPEPGAPTSDHATVAGRLGIADTALRTRVKEVRIKFRMILYRELASQRGSSENLAEEVRALCEAIAEPESSLASAVMVTRRE